MASEEAPLLPSQQHINRVQANARSVATTCFYTNHTIFVLGLILTAAKVLIRQLLSGVVVLSMREARTKKPLKLWVCGVILQDLCYFIFLLSKISLVKRLQNRLVLEVPYSVFSIDVLFTL